MVSLRDTKNRSHIPSRWLFESAFVPDLLKDRGLKLSIILLYSDWLLFEFDTILDLHGKEQVPHVGLGLGCFEYGKDLFKEFYFNLN